MRITEFSVKNYQFTIIIFVLLLLLGLGSLLHMPRGEDPPFTPPTFVVISVYPGTSPNDMEKLVADPIEEKLNELDNIKRIRSDINDGVCVTEVEFMYKENPDEKYNEVVREMNSLRSSLPADLLSIDIQKITASDINTYQLALTADSATYRQLYDEADRLKKSLETISDIKKVKIHGYPQEQVRISIDLEKMAQNRLSLNSVLATVQSDAKNIPGGSVDAGGKKFNIKTSGDYASLDEIKNTVVMASTDRIVYLRDIAAVEMKHAHETYIARFNGKKALFVSISEKDKTNIVAINKQVEQLLAGFTVALPTSIKLERGFVQAEDVSRRLSHFSKDFLIAILLVLITLIPLGSRASAIVMISIPLSIAIGLFLLDSFGYTINQLSIVGLIISLGLLVDDSIVVVENIERFLRNGYSRMDAAIKGTRQIAIAVLGCTAILIVAFLPIVFLPETSGDFIRSLPMAVILTVLASLLVSMTIVPFLASRLLKKNHDPAGNIFMQALQKIIAGSYSKLLDKALAKPKTTLLIALTLFVGSLFLFKVVGFSLFPSSEKPMFLVNIETPLGTSIYKTDSLAHEVESAIAAQPKVKSVSSNIGKGNPRIYYNIAQKNESPNYAQLFVRLEEMDFPEIEQLIQQLRTKFNNVPDATIEIKQFEQGPPVEAPIVIRVFGEDLDSLRQMAKKVENIIKSTEGTIYVSNPLQTYKTDIKVDINKDKAALLGIPLKEIDRTIRLGVSGLNVANYKDQKGDDYPISVSLTREKNQTLDVFNKIYVPSLSGAMVPVNQLSNLTFQTSVPTIKHYNKKRYIIISSSVAQGYNTEAVTKKIASTLEQLQMPGGFSYMVAGEMESKAHSFGGLGKIILITIFGFLAILLLEFKTFKSTLIVLSVIPLGVIGAVIALLISGNTLSFIAVVGIIALAGIEVKNSILLVDYTNHLRREGKTLDEAIHEAGETRFLPIILTTMTAIGGLIPLILEHSPLYSPLAWVIVGGLISSLILSRVVTPVLYKLLAPKI